MNVSKNQILVLHGPNLNLLGEREPEIYGLQTLDQLNDEIKTFAATLNLELLIFQSNSEGTLIDLLHQHRKQVRGVVINPGAYTHYSYALRDAVAAITSPTLSVIEVHLSDIYRREEFRRHSVLKDVCRAQITGKGVKSYLTGIEMLGSNV